MEVWKSDEKLQYWHLYFPFRRWLCLWLLMAPFLIVEKSHSKHFSKGIFLSGDIYAYKIQKCYTKSNCMVLYNTCLFGWIRWNNRQSGWTVHFFSVIDNIEASCGSVVTLCAIDVSFSVPTWREVVVFSSFRRWREGRIIYSFYWLKIYMSRKIIK